MRTWFWTSSHDSSTRVRKSSVESNGGHYGIWLDNTVDDLTVNKNNVVEGCYARNSASSGFHIIRAVYAKVHGNHARLVFPARRRLRAGRYALRIVAVDRHDRLTRMTVPIDLV